MEAQHKDVGNGKQKGKKMWRGEGRDETGSGWPRPDTLMAGSGPALPSLRSVVTCRSCHSLGPKTGEHGEEEQGREGLLLKLERGIQASESNLSSLTRMRSVSAIAMLCLAFPWGERGCEHPQAKERGRWRC